MAVEGVRDWYKGKSILITGGLGFMGKVLIEKLLRSCPDVGTVYVVCREKNGKTPMTRLNDVISNLRMFDELKTNNPSVLNKLVAVAGDVEQEGVVLKEMDRQKLMDNVSVVFHFAASLNFAGPLAPAVKGNIQGTLNLLKFSKNMKKLEMFVHLSTAFCHYEVDVLEEKYYPSPRDPYEIIKMISDMDPASLQAATPRILGVQPNSYTFTKRLAETVVNEYSKDMPAIIIRPSVVTPAIYEPLPGWVDRLYGPVGILVAGGKGVLRSLLCDPNTRSETVPVDIAVNAILATAANHQKVKSTEKSNDVSCYNISSGRIIPITWGEVFERGRQLFYKYPFEAGLWYPGLTVRTNPYTHALAVFLFQIIPAYFIDFLMIILRQKRFLVRLQKKMLSFLEVFVLFSKKDWDFKIDKGVYLQSKLMHPDEKDIFYIDNVDRDVDRYFSKMILGARQFCVNEPLTTLRKARIQLWLLFFLDLSVKIGLLYFVYTYVSFILESINPSYKLPMPSYKLLYYLRLKVE